MAAAKPLALLLLLVVASASAASLSGGDHLPFTLLPAGGAECRGTVGECLAGDGLDPEEAAAGDVHRRVLYRAGYISYGALRRDSVPCSRRGASYYNCRPGAQANPYSRGCSRITRCRG